MRSYKVNQQFGKRVRRARKKVDISQEKLAELINISRNHIGRIERGEVNPSLRLVQKISKSLKIKSSGLIPF